VSARGRVGASAAVLVLLLVGLAAWWRWPSSAPALDCLPGEVGADDTGALRCHGPKPLTAGQRRTLGLKLDLNAASADDLTLVPGVGPALAKAIVDRRQALGHFASWDEVDAVPGVGAERLAALREASEITVSADAGVL